MKKTKTKKPTLAQRVERLERDVRRQQNHDYNQKLMDQSVEVKPSHNPKPYSVMDKYAQAQVDKAALLEAQRIQRFCPTCNRQYNYFGK